jgi:hypothetical protein
VPRVLETLSEGRIEGVAGMNVLDALLTVTVKDLDRAQILLRSLKLVQPLRVCWVVAPDSQLDEIRRRLPSAKVRLIAESEVIPELAFYRRALRLHPRRSRRGLPGTFIHQLIKMAMARRVETPFYLTLDADVFCLKPVRYEDLVRNGRAINRRNRDENLHPDWYRSAERVLGLRRSGFEHGVTPAVLSRDAMMQLHEHLEKRVSPALRALGSVLPAGSKARGVVGSWRSYLFRNIPWTEYSLYMTFLEATNLYDRYHFDGGSGAIYSNCVWFPKKFETWDPAEMLDVEDSYFSLVQSTTGIDPRLVAEKVERVIGPLLGGATQYASTRGEAR